MKVLVVIPAYNEARRIGNVIAGALPHADAVLVVDDGSTDATAQVAAAAGAQVISHMENCGPGAATMTGIRAARAMGAHAVVTLDADEQHDPNDMPVMLRPIVDGTADIVFANRFGRRNRIPLVRRLFNAAGNAITFAATGRWVPDSQCGYKTFGPKALAELDLRMSGFEFCTEIVRECVQRQWRSAHVPVKVLYSQYTLAKGQSFAVGVRTACKILLRSFLR
ncbi:MAG: glycosyltransferase family 2 protein [Candidatus Peribacteraceae bacterium]